MKNLENILNEKVVSACSIGGGCIANSKRIITSSGKEYFVKSYTANKSSILGNEANGLRELKKANAIRIPEVIYNDDDFLIIEFIDEGMKSKDFFIRFGKQFAELHKTKAEKFGFFENNFIGSNPQINLPQSSNWSEFYWENRLLFQFRLAEKNGYVDESFRKIFSDFEKVYHTLLSGSEEEPALLHGDLWSGNFLIDEDDNPVLIDPAVYYGHREADLAMTRLFGGFDRDFYTSYNETYPLRLGWEERVDIYKLYHILNHLNLFGTGYLSQSISIMKKYL